MSKQILFLTALMMLICIIDAKAQIAISSDGSAADPSAMVEVKSGSKGFLPPRMTSIQRDAIAAPAEGLIVYNTDQKRMELFDGEEWTVIMGGWRCGLSQLEDGEGTLYNTVQIGDQCWMAENLNLGSMINSSVESSDNENVEKYCYDDNAANCSVFGGLYKWDEMMQYSAVEGGQGICPTDWHVPTYVEYTTLANYLGGENVAGDPMKATGYINDGSGLWYDDNNNATNESGFTGLPSGYLNDDNNFYGIYGYGYFWTSTLYSPNPTIYAWATELVANSAVMQRVATAFRVYGYPVRCIKNSID